VLERDEILPRPGIKAGDVLIGLASNGPHTNGYSLIRKVFGDTSLNTFSPELDCYLADALLVPHRSYLSMLYPILSHIKGLAHITGGGFTENIPRVIPDGLSVEIQLGSWPVPPLWSLIQQRGKIEPNEMYRVFNMGIGMIVIVSKENAEKVQELIPETTFIIGKLAVGEKKVIF
jgi:phosphoribosylformylglycinamidine cyclo-ligase